MISSVNGPRSYKLLPKAKIAPSKGQTTVWLSAPCLIHFESQWNHYLWEVCSADRWDAKKTATPAAGIGWQKGPNSSSWQPQPDHTSHNQRLRSWTNWATKFRLICHIRLTSCQQITTSSSILTTFCRENAFTDTAGGKKCFPRVCRILKHGFLHYRNKQIYVSLANMCWL